MYFGRNTTEECFLVSVYKEVHDASRNICDVNFDHLVKEISARFSPGKLLFLRL